MGGHCNSKSVSRMAERETGETGDRAGHNGATIQDCDLYFKRLLVPEKKS